ncbi:helix-turn-helix domain-containing protein [Candidatus Margulisiibacteriota bacterium]
MTNSKDIGQIIRFHRRQARLSQIELADLAGIGKTAVFDLEKGKETVKLITLQKVLSVLNIKLNLDSPLMAEYKKANE